MEVKGDIQKDVNGIDFVLVSLTGPDIDSIHEALAKTIQDTEHPEETNIQKMAVLEPQFLELRDKFMPS